jgi:hypothetical protein
VGVREMMALEGPPHRPHSSKEPPGTQVTCGPHFWAGKQVSGGEAKCGAQAINTRREDSFQAPGAVGGGKCQHGLTNCEWDTIKRDRAEIHTVPASIIPASNADSFREDVMAGALSPTCGTNHGGLENH